MDAVGIDDYRFRWQTFGGGELRAQTNFSIRNDHVIGTLITDIDFV